MRVPRAHTGAARAGAARVARLAPLGLAALAGACAMLPDAAPPRHGYAGPQPIAARVITLDAHCEQTEDDGFRELARLRIDRDVVQSLSWELWVGRRGGCRFERDDFEQTQRAPHIELLARDGTGCKLMVWQEPRRVTLAHAGCESRCTPGVYDRAWPVMFDPGSGRCARN